jgi:hypothetical protein
VLKVIGNCRRYGTSASNCAAFSVRFELSGNENLLGVLNAAVQRRGALCGPFEFPTHGAYEISNAATSAQFAIEARVMRSELIDREFNLRCQRARVKTPILAESY